MTKWLTTRAAQIKNLAVGDKVQISLDSNLVRAQCKDRYNYLLLVGVDGQAPAEDPIFAELAATHGGKWAVRLAHLGTMAWYHHTFRLSDLTQVFGETITGTIEHIDVPSVTLSWVSFMNIMVLRKGIYRWRVCVLHGSYGVRKVGNDDSLV